jgi:hypothetical protein
VDLDAGHLVTARTLAVRRVLDKPPDRVYAWVSDLRKMASLSDEYVGSWRFWRGAPRAGVRFVGWNRNRWRVWFTTCRVVTAEPPGRFVFDSGFLGIPIARWSYAITAAEGGGSEIVESWEDLRGMGPAGSFARWLGTVFTGTTPDARVQRNEAGMRVTLDRLAAELSRA